MQTNKATTTYDERRSGEIALSAIRRLDRVSWTVRRPLMLTVVRLVFVPAAFAVGALLLRVVLGLPASEVDR